MKSETNPLSELIEDVVKATYNAIHQAAEDAPKNEKVLAVTGATMNSLIKLNASHEKISSLLPLIAASSGLSITDAEELFTGVTGTVASIETVATYSYVYSMYKVLKSPVLTDEDFPEVYLGVLKESLKDTLEQCIRQNEAILNAKRIRD